MWPYFQNLQTLGAARLVRLLAQGGQQRGEQRGDPAPKPGALHPSQQAQRLRGRPPQARVRAALPLRAVRGETVRQRRGRPLRRPPQKGMALCLRESRHATLEKACSCQAGQVQARPVHYSPTRRRTHVSHDESKGAGDGRPRTRS